MILLILHIYLRIIAMTCIILLHIHMEDHPEPPKEAPQELPGSADPVTLNVEFKTFLAGNTFYVKRMDVPGHIYTLELRSEKGGDIVNSQKETIPLRFIDAIDGKGRYTTFN
jgi:hypothetical protein